MTHFDSMLVVKILSERSRDLHDRLDVFTKQKHINKADGDMTNNFKPN